MLKNTITYAFRLIVLVVAVLSAQYAEADSKDDLNPVETGVAALNIAPDARAAAMGDAGVATEADVNSQYWNPSKYAFAYSSAGIGLSYTPWLRKLVKDIFLANVAGYWKIGSGDNQAVSASFRYFSIGTITTSEMTIHPNDLAFDVGYARKLSTKYSMAVVLRYIYSNQGYSSQADQAKGASAFGADISGYFTTYPMVGNNECQFSFGWNISNIGSKLSYNGGNDVAYLPTNLRLGLSFAFPLADYHTLAVTADANKLLVPTKPRRSDYDNSSEGQAQWADDLEKWKSRSPISGIFKSFSDGSFKEEMREINFSIGLEYNYNHRFFLRAGYHYEHPTKGNRQYFGFGAGFALNILSLDAGYVLASSQSSPLDQTLRFSLTFDLEGIRNLIGNRKNK